MEKNIKPPSVVKQMILLVGGGWIPDFAVEEIKSKFCDI